VLTDHGVDERKVLQRHDAEEGMLVERPLLDHPLRIGDGLFVASEAGVGDAQCAADRGVVRDPGDLRQQDLAGPLEGLTSLIRVPE